MRVCFVVLMLLQLLTPAVVVAGTSSAGVQDSTAMFAIDAVLPPLPGEWSSNGLVAGSHNRFLIVLDATGEYETDTSTWTAQVELLDLHDADMGWHASGLEIAGPWHHAVALSHPRHGLIVIGGDDGTRCLADAFMLQVDEQNHALDRVTLPNLPVALTRAGGVLAGDTVYLCGGEDELDASPAEARLFSLDLSAAEWVWREHGPLPAAGRVHPVLCVWRGQVYLLGGSAVANETGVDRADAWRYDPAMGWVQRSDLPVSFSDVSGPAIGVGHDFLACAGHRDAGVHLDLVPAYHPITDRWTHRRFVADVRAGATAAAIIPVAGSGTELDGAAVLIAEGVPSYRTLRPVMVLRPHQDAALLGVLDWAAIVIYGLVLLIMGLYFMRRERGTDDYFLAGGRIPWWAAGISIFATGLSAITFMAIPAKSYDTDWIYFIQNMGVLIVIPAVVWIFLPFFRRLSVTTAYEYLEHRFHASLRLAGSAIYMLFQVGRVAIVTLLPALALSAVTGFDVTACILVMGGICIVYTVLGGIEAVIWSDVLQTTILIGGALWALVVMINGIDGGFTAFMHEASASAKFRMADVSMDLTRPTLLVIVLGAIFTSIIPYTSDQSIVQRYLTTKDEKASRRAIWLNGLMTIPASILFFGLGTALWVYYRANPSELAPTEKLDQILPYFIVDQLPAGVAGLVIAAVFAAAMSSLDSSMNSVSTAFTTDWYKRFRSGAGDAHYLRVARVATIAIGIVGTGAALFMAALDDASLLDVWFKVIGLFGSPLAGLFILGVLSRRAGALAGWCGLLAGVCSVLIASTLTPVSGLIYSVFGIVGCVGVGMVVGAVLPAHRSLKGLTLSTMPPAGE